MDYLRMNVDESLIIIIDIMLIHGLIFLYVILGIDSSNHFVLFLLFLFYFIPNNLLICILSLGSVSDFIDDFFPNPDE